MIDFIVQHQTTVFLCGGAFFCGGGISWLWLKARSSQTETELSIEKQRSIEGDALRQTLEQRLSEAETKAARLDAQLEHERAATAEKVELLVKAKQDMENTFKALSKDVLDANRESFLSLAQEKLKQFQNDASHDLEKRHKAIADLVSPVSKSLENMDKKILDLEKTRENAYGELREHLKHMKSDQDKLRSETASLVQALRSPSARGQWGELQLKRTLEMAGMVEGVHYKQQVSTENNTRPDVVVYLPGGQNIVIDAKAPIEAYLDSLKEDIDEDTRKSELMRHARHVRTHFKQLGSKKYWEQFDTPEFVVMFLPGESYLSAALDQDPSLIEAGVDNRVIPATPTTLIAMLRAVAYGWRQEAVTENAREISKLGQEMYKRLSTFGKHMSRIGSGLNTALGSYNDAVGSLERNVLSSARKFEDLKIAPEKAELPEIKPLETAPRPLTAVEFVDDDEKDEAAKPKKSKKAKKKA